jgi:hypothetical protein
VPFGKEEDKKKHPPFFFSSSPDAVIGDPALDVAEGRHLVAHHPTGERCVGESKPHVFLLQRQPGHVVGEAHRALALQPAHRTQQGLRHGRRIHPPQNVAGSRQGPGHPNGLGRAPGAVAFVPHVLLQVAAKHEHVPRLDIPVKQVEQASRLGGRHARPEIVLHDQAGLLPG